MFKKKREFKVLPTHIAFIMDGNRRWAKQRGLNKMLGHKQGAVAMKKIVDQLAELDGVKYASFFAFSTENWNREPREIEYLFQLIRNFVKDNEADCEKKNIRLRTIGDNSRLPEDLQEVIANAEKSTQDNTGLVVNLAINYGGRDDIVQAVNKLIEKGEAVSIESLKENLYSAPAPDIDLLIRTSGEMRVSNFMLFQMAYSEFYFTKKHWPEFDKAELMKALQEFAKRNRRFGGK